LYLWANQIVDISALSGLTDLTELDLWGNPLTERQVNELRNALPKCKIIF
jgi:Leucine-rich repeat (LRR) protein